MNYLLNTLKLSIYGLLWGFPVPIILALLLNRIRRTGVKKKVQLLVYMPNFISVIVLCGMVCNCTLWYGTYAAFSGWTSE